MIHPSNEPGNNMKRELTLTGMSCGHCVMAVKEALSGIEGITTDSVEIGKAVISTENYKAVENAISAALEEEGFPLESSKVV